jgi:cellulose synthase/poly-beta-1,6-N-acetylglucosamine synthase-like glycosyltransferase
MKGSRMKGSRMKGSRSNHERLGKGLMAGAVVGAGGVYLALPAALAMWATARPRRLRPGTAHPGSVTVLIVAHNESDAIVTKLDAVARQSCPQPMQVIVASDGSTDGTVALARTHPSQPIVLDLPRRGKAAALNAGVALAEGDVIVFTDANSRLDTDAVGHLLAPFADPLVGGVAGDQRYDDRASGTATGERDYWSYERLLKRWESASGNVVSSTGTLHAVRRELVDDVPDDVTDDFFISTGVVARGHRLIFAPDAVAWEQPSVERAAGYRRRVRIITRGLTGVWRRRQLLDPRHYGAYAIVLGLHKVGRRLLFIPMVMGIFGGWLVRRERGALRLLVVGQLVFYAAGVVGATASRHPISRLRMFALPAHFCTANIAAAHAVLNVARGKRFVTWDPDRP